MNLVIANQFSPFPLGRYHPKDGPYTGERFRKEYLVPALRANPTVTVVLDGAEGYGSSFLEEAFGGLVRSGEFGAAALRVKMRLVSQEDPGLIDEIWGYIDDAEQRSA